MGDVWKRPGVYGQAAEAGLSTVADRWMSGFSLLGLDDSPQLDPEEFNGLIGERKIEYPEDGISLRMAQSRVELHDQELMYNALTDIEGSAHHTGAFLLNLGVNMLDPTVIATLPVGGGLGLIAKGSTRAARMLALGNKGLTDVLAKAGARGWASQAIAKGALTEVPFIPADIAIEQNRGLDYTAGQAAASLLLSGGLNLVVTGAARVGGRMVREHSYKTFTSTFDDALDLHKSGDIDGDDLVRFLTQATSDVNPNFKALAGDVDGGTANAKFEGQRLADQWERAIASAGDDAPKLRERLKALGQIDEALPKIHENFHKAVREGGMFDEPVDEFIAGKAVADFEDPVAAVEVAKKVRQKKNRGGKKEGDHESLLAQQGKKQENANARSGEKEAADALASQTGKATTEDFKDFWPDAKKLPNPKMFGSHFTRTHPLLKAAHAIAISGRGKTPNKVAKSTARAETVKGELADWLQSRGIGLGRDHEETMLALDIWAEAIYDRQLDLNAADNQGIKSVGVRNRDGVLQYGTPEDFGDLENYIAEALSELGVKQPRVEIAEPKATAVASAQKVGGEPTVIEAPDIRDAKDRLLELDDDAAKAALKRVTKIQAKQAEAIKAMGQCQITPSTTGKK